MVVYHDYVVVSTLRYGIIFQDNPTNRELVIKTEKICLKAICSVTSLDSCAPHFKSLKMLTLPYLFIYEIAVFVKTNPTLKKKHLIHEIKEQ